MPMNIPVSDNAQNLLKKPRMSEIEPKNSIIITDPLMNQIDHFCSVIKGSKAPLISAEEGLKNLRVLEGIYESAESGETFKIT